MGQTDAHYLSDRLCGSQTTVPGPPAATSADLLEVKNAWAPQKTY